MYFNYPVYIYGNDKRQIFLGKLLKKNGFNVINVSECKNDSSDISYRANEPEIIIVPIAAPKDIFDEIIPFIHKNCFIIGGLLPSYLTDICIAEGASFFDYIKLPQLAILNAVATAEGAICEAIRYSDINIQGSRCLVIGYGKCGSVIASKLHALKADTYVLTNNDYDKSRITANGLKLHENDFSIYDHIFNTAPSPVITPQIIDSLCDDCTIIDIASSPGGTDFDYCKKKNIKAKLCLGLPAEYSPKTSAEIILKEIITAINTQKWSCQ